MDYSKLYDLLKIDKKLVTDFSILFSRFEYALKRTKNYANGDEKRVDANWTKFARDHDSIFDAEKTAALKSAVHYLISKPTRKQILKDGKLDFKVVQEQNNPLLEQVLGIVRRTRNNLFHGGKFPHPTGPVEEPGRDKKLLCSCITILKECLALNKEICDNFDHKP